MPRKSSLTSYPSGSLGEIFTLALPMMLTALSNNLMLFLDRIILGHYSLEAMNSAAAAGSATLPFVFGGYAITAIAEVFVGQRNGARKYSLVAQPVWQMLWFSLMLMLFFIPMGLFMGPFILVDSFLKEGLPYYQWLMCFGFLTGFHTALSSFFIGRGHVKLIAFVAIFGNILNLLLDLLLVFGIPHILDPMGTAGAAIGTVIAEGIQVFILFVVFLNKENRHVFKTHVWRFKPKLFKDCLRIGTPNALSHLITMSAWYVIFAITGLTSPEHVTVFQIGQTIFVLFTFLADGIQKGIIALASNAIGGGFLNKVPEILKSSIKLHVVLVSLLAIPFLVFPEVFIKLFLSDQNLSVPLDVILYQGTQALIWVWLFLFCDDLVWMIAGILTAGEDTKFVMIMNGVSTWFFGVVPIYLFIFKWHYEPSTVWPLMFGYGIINCIFFFWRYSKGKWKNVVVS